MVGGVLVLLGAWLVLRPFAALTALVLTVAAALVVAGAGELVPRDAAAPAWRRARAAGYLLAAVVLLAWPAAGVRVVAVTVAAALLVGGVTDLGAARTVRGRDRVDGVVGGATSVVLGLLALAWPDVTVLVVSVVFGAHVVLAGARLVTASGGDHGLTALHRRPPPGVLRPGARDRAGTVLGAALAVALVAVSLTLHRGTPVPDAFYDAPDALPAAPGRLVRSEPFTGPEIPDGARAWRVLHTTTRDEGVPALASAVVIAPARATTTPSPVVAWAHGTTGFARGCAPSVLEDGLAAGAMTIQDQVVDAGWTLVATDYVGLGTEGPHPYLVGQGEGRSVLDAVRAAYELDDVRLARRTVVWGHSQGGHAALWAGALAPTYAPGLPVDGVAAVAPAADLPALVEDLGDATGGDLFASFVLAAYAATYPDVRAADYVRPGARILTEEMGARCLAERSTLVSALTSLTLGRAIWSRDPAGGALGERLAQNVPPGPIDAPLLVAQGAADTLVVPSVQAAYVRARCDAGEAVDYRTYDGLGHLPVVEAGSPAVADLLTWTAQRFAGEPATSTC